LSDHIILVGGGLANGLIAHRLAETRPQVRITLLERGATLGGNHTWSFHETDLSPEARASLAPFVVHRWPGQAVRFAGAHRHLATPYCSIASDRFHAVLMARLGGAVRTGVAVSRLEPHRVVLEDGSSISGDVVVDGRGFPRQHGLKLGYQKFYGLEIRTERPHGLAVPIIMDATVPQADGFRFVYTLPFAADRLLIEDTRYADGPALDTDELHAQLQAYARQQGYGIAEVIRAEHGILPVALGGDIASLFPEGDHVVRAGLAAGLFHQTTGYSLPDAVALAELVATSPPRAAPLAARVRAHAAEAWRRRAFFRLLNRMLFQAARPDQRDRVFARFYTLGQPLIERFYADRLTLADKARILTGRPPVPIHRALRVLFDTPRRGGLTVREAET
jgi:lycopene beta-cyclase